MSKKDNVSKIKSYIEDVLGAKGNLRDKLPAKMSYKRDLFCQVLQNLQFVNGRTLGMKHDYKVNFMDYDDPFYVALENLLKLHYTQEQRNLINWWLYEKYLPSGEVLILTDKETEEIIPSDTPEDIWNLMQEHEKKNHK
tara:strand:+ start:346 stop:762 length:417 start_codon:yes stop_codon:yes gene_type:complete